MAILLKLVFIAQKHTIHFTNMLFFLLKAHRFLYNIICWQICKKFDYIFIRNISSEEILTCTVFFYFSSLFIALFVQKIKSPKNKTHIYVLLPRKYRIIFVQIAYVLIKLVNHCLGKHLQNFLHESALLSL